ncbi:hypothetical protein EDC96DRAFT_593536 [Choanephora cucurbitarum]|nr:hypothetical protein EDC96DRAFT_593536 [Choanephora cucurbitarum]
MDANINQFAHKLSDPLGTYFFLVFVRSVLSSILLTWTLYLIKPILVRVVQFYVLLWKGWSPNHALLSIVIEMLDTQPDLTDIDLSLPPPKNDKVSHNKFIADQPESSLPELSTDELHSDLTLEDTTWNETTDDTSSDAAQIVATDTTEQPKQSNEEIYLDKTSSNEAKDTQSSPADKEQKGLKLSDIRNEEEPHFEQLSQHYLPQEMSHQNNGEKSYPQLTQLQSDQIQHQHKQQERQAFEPVEKGPPQSGQQQHTNELNQERSSTLSQYSQAEKARKNREYLEQKKIYEEQYKQERIRQIQSQLQKDRLKKGQRYKELTEQQKQQLEQHSLTNQEIRAKQTPGILKTHKEYRGTSEQPKDMNNFIIDQKITQDHRHVSFNSVSTKDANQSSVARQISSYAFENNFYNSSPGIEAEASKNSSNQQSSTFLDQPNRGYGKSLTKNGGNQNNSLARERNKPSSSKASSKLMQLDSQTEIEEAKSMEGTPSLGSSLDGRPDIFKLKQVFSQEIFKDDHEKAEKINAALTFASMNRSR